MANVYVRSGAGGAATGADWANAYLTLAAALAAKAAGDDFWVAGDHSESTAGAVALTSPGTVSNPCRIICVNHAGTVPPVSADLLTTGAVATTGANSITFTGFAYCYGLNFTSGSGASTGSLLVGGTASTGWRFDSCKLILGNTSASSVILVGNATVSIAQRQEWNNTTVKFGSTSQSVSLRNADLRWTNTASAVDSAGSSPANLFLFSQYGGTIFCEGLDLSFMGSGKNIFGATTVASRGYLKDCKVNSAVTVSATPAAPGAEFFISRSDSAAASTRNEKYSYHGTETTNTAVVRTSGATDGATKHSRKIVTTANTNWWRPFHAMPVAIYNSSVSTNVTATIEGIYDGAALPNNDELWFTTEYLGSTLTPVGSFGSGTKADALASGSALTASSSAWDSMATARQNSTAYALGDVIKVATNSGRVFICTSAGTSASSEPAGYASAVDGGSVTDDGATFRAAVRFKQAIAMTSPQPGLAGLMYVYPRAGLASKTYYIDPFITLS